MAPFDHQLLAIGTLVSVLRSLANIWAVKALTLGQPAVVTALLTTSSLFLVMVEGYRTSKMPTSIEFACLITGLIGTLELIIPKHMDRLFFCCKENDDVSDEPESYGTSYGNDISSNNRVIRQSAAVALSQLGGSSVDQGNQDQTPNSMYDRDMLTNINVDNNRVHDSDGIFALPLGQP